MNAEQLLAHFDRVGDAPDAIPRLRRFILDLAVRGKLVEQDPTDEPASELLKRIDEEKERLAREGNPRRPRATRLVASTEEQPYDLPTSWEWTRFGNIASFSAGRTPSRHDFSFWNTGDHNWVSIADMNNGGVVLTTKETVSEKAKTRLFRSEPSTVGTMIMSFKLTIGKVSRLGVPAFHNEAIISIHPHLPHMDEYLFKVLPQFSQRGETKDAIKGATLNRDSIAAIRIPLPPLAEQHRIVAKVDELMALCDELEAAQEERERRRDRLAAASLHRLNQPAATDDTEEFREHARFHLDHLARVTARPDQIKQLRETILNLAVRGRLVAQDPGDEPVSASLKSDGAETNTVDLPASWSIAPLAIIASHVVDCPHSTPSWTAEGRICVRTNQFHPGFLDLLSTRFVSESTYRERIQRLKPIEGDILYSREGGILGVACRVPPNVKLCLGQRMMLIRSGETVQARFLEMVLNSPLVTGIALARTTGAAAPRINVATVKAYPIPVPPLGEQGRIVAKVDELMALCDALEAQLTNTGSVQSQLLDALLHEALGQAA